MIALGAIVALAAAAAVSPAPSPSPPPAPRAETTKGTDGTVVELRLDGPLLGTAFVRRGDRRWLLLLSGPAEDEKPERSCAVEADAAPAPRRKARLHLWDPAQPADLVTLGGELPEGMLEAADLDGDGTDEAIVYGEAGIEELAVDLQAKTVLAKTIVTGRYTPAERLDPDDRALRAISLGLLSTFRRGEGGALRPTGEVELPVRVAPSATQVRVSTRSVEALGKLGDGRPRFATPAEPVGVERLRTIVLDPDGPPDARTYEAWARFPSRERALEHALVRLDGEPALVVLTTTADKLSLFGEKRLRVFRLEPDRTRMGAAPKIALETGINLWQPATPTVLDLDGDGREDLVLAYWKGLKDSIAALEVHRRAPDGSLGGGATTDFDVEDGDRGFIDFGHDLDGDGRPDLAVLGGGALLIYPGSPREKAIDRAVGKTPSRRIPLPGDLAHGASQTMSFGPEGLSVDRARGSGVPRFLDLDGDGRVEAMFTGETGPGGRVVIVRFR